MTLDVPVTAASVAVGPIVRVWVGLEVPVPVMDREGEGEDVPPPPFPAVPVTLREAAPVKDAMGVLVGVPEEFVEGLASPLGVAQEEGVPDMVPTPTEGVAEVVVVRQALGDTVVLVLPVCLPLPVLHWGVDGEGVEVGVLTVHLEGVWVED